MTCSTVLHRCGKLAWDEKPKSGAEVPEADCVAVAPSSIELYRQLRNEFHSTFWPCAWLSHFDPAYGLGILGENRRATGSLALDDWAALDYLIVGR
jgi:hypothetical protein